MSERGKFFHLSSNRTQNTWLTPYQTFGESKRTLLSDGKTSILLRRELSYGDVSNVDEGEGEFTRIFRKRVIQSRRLTWRKAASKRQLRTKHLRLNLQELKNIPENDFVKFQGISGYCLHKFWNDVRKSTRFPNVKLYIHKKTLKTVAWDGKRVTKTSEGLLPVCSIVNETLETKITCIKKEDLVLKPRIDWTIGDVTDFCILPACLKPKMAPLPQRQTSIKHRQARIMSLFSLRSRSHRSAQVSLQHSTSFDSLQSRPSRPKSDPEGSRLTRASTKVKRAATRPSAEGFGPLACFLNDFDKSHLGRRFQGAYVIHTRSMKFQELIDATKQYIEETQAVMSTEVFFFLKFMSTDFVKLKAALSTTEGKSVESYRDFFCGSLQQGIDSFQERLLILDDCEKLFTDASTFWECYGVLKKQKPSVVITSSQNTAQIVDEAIATDILFDVINQLDPKKIYSFVKRDKELLESVIHATGNGFRGVQEQLINGFTQIFQEELNSYQENLDSLGDSVDCISDLGAFYTYQGEFFLRRKDFTKAFANFQKAEQVFQKLNVEAYLKEKSKDEEEVRGAKYYLLSKNPTLVKNLVVGLVESRLGCAKSLLPIETTTFGYDKIFGILDRVDSIIDLHYQRLEHNLQAKKLKHKLQAEKQEHKLQAELIRAEVFSEMKDYRDAISSYESVEIQWKIMPSKAKAVAAILRTIAALNIKMNNSSLAVKNLNKAFKKHNAEDLTKADILTELGDALLNIKDHIEAEQNYLAAQEIIEKSIGKWNDRIGHISFKLAECLILKGNYKEALRKAVRVRAINTKLFGRISLKVAQSSYYIGFLQLSRASSTSLSPEEIAKHRRLACKNFRGALEVARAVNDRESMLEKTLLVAKYAVAVAQTLQKMRTSKELYEHLLEEALEIREREYGVKHHLTEEIRNIMQRNIDKSL